MMFGIVCGGTLWSQFKEVWQYGSNLDQGDPDPIFQQDGVAPQCGCLFLSSARRVFIPGFIATKGFVGSHSISNYKWIFTTKQIGDDGYVRQRK